jgi:hypothetical protein
MPYQELKQLELENGYTEKRWLLVMTSLGLVGNMLGLALRMTQNTPHSIAHQIVVATGIPNGLMAAVFVCCALMLLPNTLMVMMHEERSKHRTVMQFAAAGSAGAGLAWLAMCFLARSHGLDAQDLTAMLANYMQNAVLSMGYATVLGIILNNIRRRELKGASYETRASSVAG